ncbi:hypothetical protein ACO1PF_10415 [Alkalibacterium sp. f15]|uniref:hypothetical protein n=1 Tax=Alkalibacterium sp. f15 TaxID=3414029 RepID=UPI003BF7CC28
MITEIPTSADIVEEGTNYYVDGKFISQKLITANVTNLETNAAVSGQFTLDIELASNYDSVIDKVSIELNDEVIVFESDQTIELDTNGFSTGNKRLLISVETVDGRTDSMTHRLKLE